MGSTLTVLPSFRVWPADDAGRYVINRKFLLGIAEYQKHWDGPVQVVVESGPPEPGLDDLAVHPAELSFDLHVISCQPEVLAPLLRQSAAALLAVHYRQIPLARLCARLGVPAVYIAENALRTRLQVVRTRPVSPLRQLAGMAWELREERRIRAALRLAAGVQCNGTPTYASYRGLTDSLLYFDTRATEDLMPHDESLHHKYAAGARLPLRLAFSGRLIAIKGCDDLIALARTLRARRLPFQLSICGSGDREPALRHAVDLHHLQHHVRFLGVLPFRERLAPFLRDEVDLFVCCHCQGDPSCTYLETMAAGVPIVGYSNQAFAGLCALSGAGWTVPMNRPQALADTITRLAAHREELLAHALKSLAFARQHSFERTFAARMAHLRQFIHQERHTLPRPPKQILMAAG